MTTLLLVRHGESEANKNEFFAGQYDADLVDRGIEQAQKTAQYIKENYKVDKIYASDLKRAFRTGKAIADLLGLDVTVNKNLREICAGKWDGISFVKLAAMYADDYKVWTEDIGNAVCTGGETVRQLGERVVAAITDIAKDNDGKTIVIATHATPIRAMQSFVENGNFEDMKNVPWVSNASVSVFEYNNGTWTISKISEDKHLGKLKTVLPKNV